MKNWKDKEHMVIMISISIVALVVNIALYDRFIKKEIIEDAITVFDVQHKTDQQGRKFTFVYTYGKGRLGFIGDFYNFELDKTYFIKYQKGKTNRWKEHILLEFEEIQGENIIKWSEIN
jgi:hypothetical protein